MMIVIHQRFGGLRHTINEQCGGRAMHGNVETGSGEMASFLEVVELASRAQSLAARPFNLAIADVEIVCLHPLTNQGSVDEDYLVIYATGFEKCEVWVYKGEVNLISTLEKFRLFGASGTSVCKLTEIYQMAIDRSSLNLP